jgi:hypothetical protein
VFGGFTEFGDLGDVEDVELGSILPPGFVTAPSPDIYVNFKTGQAQKGSVVVSANSVVTVSRASPATQVDTSGNWSQFGNNILSSSSLGASIWEARTNGIRNNTMAGAVVMADGVELTSNGNFASAGSGWTVADNSGNNTGVVFATGQVTLKGDGVNGNNNAISQLVSGLIVGRSYVVSITAASPSPSAFQISVGSSAFDITVLNKSPVIATGSANSTIPDRVAFTATATSHWITLGRQNTVAAAINSISVQDGERCQNGGFTSNPLNAAPSTVQNGWQWVIAPGTGTVVYTPGTPNVVTLTGDGTNAASLGISIPTVAGFTYTITVDIGSNTTFVQAGTAFGGTTLLNSSASAGTGQKFQFTASGVTSWVTFKRILASGSTIANVSVQSAGALPTNWLSTSALNNGVVIQVTNLGAESGINYLDLQYVGTSTAGASPQIAFESTSQIAALYGQTWTSSVFAYVSGGSTANLSTFVQGFDENQSGGTFIASHNASFTPSSVGPLGSNRLTNSATVNASNAGAVKPYIQFHFNISVAVNITLRIGWPQLENNALINSTVASAAIQAAGSGGTDGTAVYSVGGGTGPTTATLNITITGGVLSAVNSVANAGSYTTFPPSPAALTYVSGTGTGLTGATVNLTPTNNAAQAASSNPILTSSVAVTRNAEADTLVLTGLPAFSSAYTLWTRFTNQMPAAYGVTQTSISPSDGTSNNRNSQYLQGTTAKGGEVGIVANSATYNFSTSNIATPNTSNKLASVTAASDQAVALNGGTVATASNASVPSGLNTVSLGHNINGSTALDGNLEEIAIWFTQRLPNATLQAITT